MSALLFIYPLRSCKRFSKKLWIQSYRKYCWLQNIHFYENFAQRCAFYRIFCDGQSFRSFFDVSGSNYVIINKERWIQIFFSRIAMNGVHHGLINYKDRKICHYPKKLPCTGLCDTCLLEFIDWRYSLSCLYFRHSFVNYCPSNLLSDSPPPLPFLCQQYIQTVCSCEGVGGWWVLLETIFCRIQNLEKLLVHPKQKPRKGGGLIQINTCSTVPLQVIFVDDDILHCFLSVSSFCENLRLSTHNRGREKSSDLTQLFNICTIRATEYIYG